MSVNDGAADRKAQAGASNLIGSATKVLVENSTLLPRRKTGPTIEYFDFNRVGAAPSNHLHRAALRRVLESILDQVDEHLLHQHIVDCNHWQIRRNIRQDSPS